MAIAVLLLEIINIQLQQMFAFFMLYQRWANEYREMTNIAILRRRRHLRRVRNRPYTWTIPRPAESWFDIHYNDPTIPQEYFRQQLRVNRNTFETILHILGQRLERRNTRFRNCLPPAKVLALGLYRLAHGIHIPALAQYLMLVNRLLSRPYKTL